MRELTFFEVEATAGSGGCVDLDGLWKIAKQTMLDGATFGAIVGTMTTVLTYACCKEVWFASKAGIGVGIVAGVYGIYDSKAWDIIK